MVLLTFCTVTLDPTRPFQAQISSSAQSSRYQALTTSLMSISRAPLLGTGPNTHPGRYLNNAFDAHMSYAGIAGTLGLPALAFFACLLCAAWFRRLRPTELSLWGGMAGLALDGLGQDIESFRHLWILVGLVLARAARPHADVDSTQLNMVLDQEKPVAAAVRRTA
jgi:O-antigen ligase